MGWILPKYLLTAAVVVVVSEAAKRSDKIGALILPMFLAFPWLLARPWLLAGARRASVVLTATCFGLFALALRRFGVTSCSSQRRLVGRVGIEPFLPSCSG
jgi:hypothetical protein